MKPRKRIKVERLSTTRWAKNWRQSFESERNHWHNLLAESLRLKAVDPLGKSLVLKARRLPFAVITYSCDGHFLKSATDALEKHVPANKLGQHKAIFYTTTEFHIELDLSPRAKVFLREVNNLVRRLPFITVEGWTHMVFLKAHSTGARKRQIKSDEAMRILKEKKLFIQELERLVDRFLREKNN